MRQANRITSLWPGLLRLWHHGDFFALATAIAFAVLLNGVLVASFVRPGSVSGSWTVVGWGVAAALWGLGAWRAIRYQSALGDISRSHDQQDLLIRAQAEYLKGHWVEAQTLLEEQICRLPGDVESHLLLSSVYRRSRRIDSSRRQLGRVQGLENAQKWHLEIQRELAMLDRASASGV